LKDYRALSKSEKSLVKAALVKFIADLEAGHFRRSLRVKGIQGAPGIFEMTWADDGRTTFQYGAPVEGHENEPHVIWRRIGRHDIFGSP
jgi:hypothetical protein